MIISFHSLHRLLSIAIAGAVLSGMAVLSGCDRKAKKEAALAIEAARLSVADAQKAATSAPATATALVQDADAALKKAERSYQNGEYVRARSHADLAMNTAKEAQEEAQRKPAKKPAAARKKAKS